MESTHNKFTELVSERMKNQTDWIKTAIGSISALLGIIIAFDNSPNTSLTSNILFSITIVSQSLCILSGLLYLYNNSDVTRQQVQQYIVQTKNLTQPLKQGIATYERKIFSVLRTLFFTFLILSITSLISYSIYSRFN